MAQNPCSIRTASGNPNTRPPSGNVPAPPGPATSGRVPSKTVQPPVMPASNSQVVGGGAGGGRGGGGRGRRRGGGRSRRRRRGPGAAVKNLSGIMAGVAQKSQLPPNSVIDSYIGMTLMRSIINGVSRGRGRGGRRRGRGRGRGNSQAPAAATRTATGPSSRQPSQH